MVQSTRQTILFQDFPTSRRRCDTSLKDFYSISKHDVVTPENMKLFLAIHRRWCELKHRIIQWDMQELWAGSARTSGTGFRQGLYVGFPIDARYGWNFMDASHRRLLDEVERFFLPVTELHSPECTAWSIAANTSNKEEKQQDRDKSETDASLATSSTQATCCRTSWVCFGATIFERHAFGESYLEKHFRARDDQKARLPVRSW